MSRCSVRGVPLVACWCILAVLIFWLGCSSPSDETTDTTGNGKSSSKPAPIHVVVVDDEPLAETIARQWKAASGGEIRVDNVSESEVSSLKSKTAADVLIYPSPWLGELVEAKRLIPISSRVLNDPQYDRLDIMPLDRADAVTWGEKTYAFSFGVPQFVLMYRKDVFERLRIAPPSTWKEYQQTIDRLSSEVEAGQSRYAALEPLAPGWASQMLLARAAGYARQRSRYWTLFNYETMEPMINGPPFRRALDELVAAAGDRQEVAMLAPETVRKELLAGHSQMAITWPSERGVVSADSNVDIGFALLPGVRQVYDASGRSWQDLNANGISRVSLFGFDGRLGSVLTSSAHPRDAFNFLAWLSGGERSAAIASRSSHTAPFRKSHKSKAHLWLGEVASRETAEGYFSAVDSSKHEPMSLAALPIPGREQYLKVLDRAVHDALDGADSGEALDAAAAEWRQVTKRLGLDKQRAAYKRSLGIES